MFEQNATFQVAWWRVEQQSPPLSWLVHLGWVWGAGRPHLYLLRKGFSMRSQGSLPPACTDRKSARRSGQPQGAAPQGAASAAEAVPRKGLRKQPVPFGIPLWMLPLVQEVSYTRTKPRSGFRGRAALAGLLPGCCGHPHKTPLGNVVGSATPPCKAKGAWLGMGEI